MHYTTLHFSAVQCSASRCSEVQCSAVQCSDDGSRRFCLCPVVVPGSSSLSQATLHCSALHCIALNCTALHCTALHCTALHCTALHCTALHCTALHCTALHCLSPTRNKYIGNIRSITTPRLREFPRAKPEGTPKSSGLNWTLYPGSSPKMDSI